ncbi:MAG: ComEA family DNA-binding protein [Chitinophagaceae bacterium]
MKWREWFVFSARERTGVLVLVGLILVVYSFPWWNPWKEEEVVLEDAQLAALLGTIKEKKGALLNDTTVPAYTYERKTPYKTRDATVKNLPGKQNSYYAPKRPPPSIDINTATLEEWDALPGIGQVLGTRIIAFRDKLGGFIHKEQVGETYGLKDSVFRKIVGFLKESPQKVRRLPVNSVSEEELAAHPLIRWKLAKQLVAFRKAHGGIKDLAELHKLLSLDSVQVNRLGKYLDFGY